MSEPKRRRRPPAELPEFPSEEYKDCETEFYGSFTHVALSCLISLWGSSAFLTFKNPDFFSTTNIVNIGLYYVHFLLFLYLTYLLLSGLSCLFSKK